MLKEFKIVDVDESNKADFCICLEDWSEEIKEAGDHKACWYERMKNHGLGAKMVYDADGTLSGLIQYVPAEYAPLTGGNYYFIYCVWVHGHKQGIGDRRGSGMGSALLKAAEEDIRERGADGIAAWGVSMPFWMKASWYKKQGYEVVQKDGMRRLLWKSFNTAADKPQWLKNIKKPESLAAQGKVRVTSLRNGICPVMNLAFERSKSVSSEFGDSVVFQEVVTEEPAVLREWGISDTLYINGTEIPLGPPLAKKKIRAVINKELKKAGKSVR